MFLIFFFILTDFFPPFGTSECKSIFHSTIQMMSIIPLPLTFYFSVKPL